MKSDHANCFELLESHLLLACREHHFLSSILYFFSFLSFFLSVSLNLSQVSKKEELRSRLAELLLPVSGPQQTHCHVGKEEDKMKRPV